MSGNVKKRGKPLFDSAKIKRILTGDRSSREWFVTEHYPRIFRMLRYLTDDPEVAEDLTQQTFVKAWQALGKFRNKSLLITWMHSIAYHEYTHWLRSHHAHTSLESIAEIPYSPMEPQWEAMELRHELNRLTEELRETFILFHVQELTVLEVATVLNVPAGTVKSRLFTARRLLREALKAHIDDTTSDPAIAKGLLPCDPKGGTS